jgi:SIR2-like domain
MQFVRGGPDIPEHLLQAHEDGRVVFFCGAGISYPAGLPGFKGLVDDIYRRVGTIRSAIEQEAYCRTQFDATLDLLERRIPGQRIAVRTALAQALQPRLRRKGATDTHTALLQLARCREGALRLVTTNFDRVFDRAAQRAGLTFNAYAAPMLPIPKSSRWNGLVYLHGLLPEKVDNSALQRLVVTSGDFGLAYLTERWAARFVSELFRNYVVCFVGYSINDPVLRYMMDALAADRLLGQSPTEVFAFASFSKDQEKLQKIEWSAKNVTPVLYRAHSKHFYLHKTLQAWADHYRDGISANERIISRHASSLPAASTEQDDVVGRVLWALSDPSGAPARLFAELDPVPPLDWLKPLNEERFGHHNLRRFGIQPTEKEDTAIRFSLLSRFAKYDASRSMTLVSDGRGPQTWDAVMRQIARWTLRHLNSPRLLLWFAAHGGKIDPFLANLMSDALKPGGMYVSPAMRILWSLLLADRVR